MKKLSFVLLLFVFLISAANSRVSAKSAREFKGIGKMLCDMLSYFAEYVKYSEDAKLLAEVMYHENWSTDSEHLAAYYTGAVVLNRVKSDEWPDSVHDVIYQRGQYSTVRKFYSVEIPKECFRMAMDLLRNGSPDVPETVVFQAQFRQGSGLWKKVNTDYFCYG